MAIRTSLARKGKGRRAGGPLGCVLATAMLAALAPAGASAGTWNLASCSQPDGAPAPIDGWRTTSIGGVGADSGDIDTCPQGGALTALTSGEAPQTAYTGPEWVFTAPPGSTIIGGTLTGTLTSPHGQAWLATPNSSYDSADVLVNCQYNLACGQSGLMSGTFPISHAGGTNIYAAAVCVGPQEGASSCPAYGGVDAAVSVSGADIELSSSSSPTGSGFGGTLLDAGARGTRELTFTAGDPEGPGVYSVRGEVDGETLYAGTPDENEGQCAALTSTAGELTFDRSQPCKQSESIDLPIDTTPLADGQHTLKVTVKDAAGNSSVVLDDAISTHNAPVNTAPPSILEPAQTTVGSGVAAQAGSWSAPAGAGTISYSYQWQSCGSEGASCTAIAGATTAMYNAVAGDAGRTLRVIVSAADSDGSTSTVSAASGPIAGGAGAPSSSDAAPASAESDVGNGVGASESAELQLSGKGTIARAFARRALKIGGRLLNGRRQPIAGAQLQVLEQPAGSSAAHVIGQVGTSSAGAFTASVPGGPSRVIEIAYRAFSADAGYAAAGYVHESVAAGVRLSVTPRATFSTGRIVLSGSVQGPVPAAGALVELLVRYRGHWEPFRTPHTTAAGRFRVIYQFEGAVGWFPFMARVPAGQAGLPYATGRSAAVRVLTG
jgi:hypothetical protein